LKKVVFQKNGKFLPSKKQRLGTFDLISENPPFLFRSLILIRLRLTGKKKPRAPLKPQDRYKNQSCKVCVN
jgi:hypothetical protein